MDAECAVEIDDQLGVATRPSSVGPSGRAEPRAGRSLRKTDAGRRVGDLLRAELLAGRFGTGTLPMEDRLSAVFHVSRNAVREALDLLRREGLVERKQGAGTMVVSKKAMHAFNHLHSVADSFGDAPPRFTVIDAALYPAPPLVSCRLELEPGADAFFLERVMRINGEPFSIRSSWMPAFAERAFRSADLTYLHFYDLLERHLPIDPSSLKAHTRVEAVAADDAVAPILGVEPRSPLFFIERLATTADGPIEFGFTRARGDRVALESDMAREIEPPVHAHRDPVGPPRGA